MGICVVNLILKTQNNFKWNFGNLRVLRSFSGKMTSTMKIRQYCYGHCFEFSLMNE